jgi:hypothetical protein
MAERRALLERLLVVDPDHASRYRFELAADGVA